MKCLIIGSGGREHALAWKIAQSPEISRLYIAPGNAGTSEVGKNIPIPADEIDSLLSFAEKERIDLTVVGPETPLAKGIVNLFQKKGLPIFGPNQAAAQLETSKIFAKKFMVRHRIPTAEFQVAASLSEGRSILEKWGGKPAVIKVDGLAAGKGVFICDTRPEKEAALKQIFSHKIFKSAGKKAIIEKKLNGEEVSLLAITDGKKYHSFPPAQDHKKIGENDLGPNTGGMGAVAPNPFLLPSVKRQVIQDMIAKTISGLAEEGITYQGILYAGLILTSEGPQLLEFNARFGDPETQAIIPLFEGDLLQLLLTTAQGNLLRTKPVFRKGSACSVVMTAAGYPGPYQKNQEISGLKTASELRNVLVFHAGTTKKGRKTLTSGGRVLNITGFGKNLTQAIANAYLGVSKINFAGAYFRRDIGQKALRQSGNHPKNLT
ncbi:MAG: phosphoribosylamine--glycine ligase [Candidatus Omnitrophica bacterium]|nr:phosphoribosylamine--glycine ligase [Candidatus Omnitrophota bacterium]